MPPDPNARFPLAHAFDAVLMFGSGGIVTGHNALASELAGESAALIGLPFTELLTGG